MGHKILNGGKVTSPASQVKRCPVFIQRIVVDIGAIPQRLLHPRQITILNRVEQLLIHFSGSPGDCSRGSSTVGRRCSCLCYSRPKMRFVSFRHHATVKGRRNACNQVLLTSNAAAAAAIALARSLNTREFKMTRSLCPEFPDHLWAFRVPITTVVLVRATLLVLQLRPRLLLYQTRRMNGREVSRDNSNSSNKWICGGVWEGGALSERGQSQIRVSAVKRPGILLPRRDDKRSGRRNSFPLRPLRSMCWSSAPLLPDSPPCSFVSITTVATAGPSLPYCSAATIIIQVSLSLFSENLWLSSLSNLLLTASYCSNTTRSQSSAPSCFNAASQDQTLFSTVQ